MTDKIYLLSDADGTVVFTYPEKDADLKEYLRKELDMLYDEYPIWSGDGCIYVTTMDKLRVPESEVNGSHITDVLGDFGYITDLDGVEKIELDDPISEPAPDCVDEKGHVWTANTRMEGGIKENPGVWGHGGGVTMHEHCSRPGCYCMRDIDTWATDPNNGTQGHKVISYDEMDSERIVIHDELYPLEESD